MKKTICLDFDGVIHKYDEGWQDGKLYADVTDGFFEWLVRMYEQYDLVVFSSRSKSILLCNRMKAYLDIQAAQFCARNSAYDKQTVFKAVDSLRFATEKPAAWLSIDDRAITFKGNWSEITETFIDSFKPWNKK